MSRPPATVHPYNPNVSPQTYEPKIDISKPSGSTKCTDAFGKSKVLRTILWEKEIENKENNLRKSIKNAKE